MQQGVGTTRRGAPVQGVAIGLLMLESRFPRIPGDLGNAGTFPFPVLYKVVAGATPDAVVRRGAAGLREALVAGARELVATGARGIVCNCGFLAGFQQVLAQAAGVPVLASSLVQVPWVERLLPPGRRAGILTISAATLTPELLAAAGVDPGVAVVGTEGGREFSRAILDDRAEMDVAAARADLVDAARELARREPQLGAIVLECTNMSPFAGDLQRATGVPVATPYGLVCWFRSMLQPRDFLAPATGGIAGDG